MKVEFISDHAVLRWLERVDGVDLSEVRERIKLACEIGMVDDDGAIHVGFAKIILENGRVVTVLGAGQRPTEARRMRRRRKAARKVISQMECAE